MDEASVETNNKRNLSKTETVSTSSIPEGRKLTQYLAAIVVNLAAFSNGTVVGWSSPMIPVLQAEDSPLDDGPVSNEISSWLGSLMCLGALLATPIYLYLMHHFSRKITGYLVAVPFIVSWILVIGTNSSLILCVARFIGGIGSGAATVFCPVYVSEIAEDSVRGALGSYLILFCNAGILFAYVLGSQVSYYTFAYIIIQIPLLYILCFVWLPETPIYLINKGDNGMAEQSLRWLRGKNDNIIKNELSKTISFVKERKAVSESANLKDILALTGNRRALLIGIVLVTNLQFCGVFAILSYSVNIFQEAGSELSPHISTIIIGFVQFVGSCVSSLLIDKGGRKILLLVSNASMAICLAAIGSYFYLKFQGSDLSAIGWIPVTSLSVYIFSIALGLAPVTFVIIAEIFDPQIKGKATTIIISIMWFLTFVIAKFYNNMSELMGIHGCYWFFSVCCVLGSIYSIVVIPETKNRSYESILLELSGEKVRKNKDVENEAENL